MTDGLRKDASEWYGGCVDAANNKGFATVNRELAGEAALVVSIYQYAHVVDLMSSKQYIAPDDGKEFMTILFLMHCKGDPEMRNDYWGRLMAAKVCAPGEALEIVTLTVAKHMAQDQNSLGLIGMLAPLVPLLGTYAWAVTAHAFGDKETIDRIRESIQRR